MTQLGFVFDLDRCMDVRACMGACKQENNVALGSQWNRVYTVTTGDFPNHETYFIPITCQHCRKPACVSACPNGAFYKRKDGIVLIAKEKCTDCMEKPCMKSCPYDAISYNEQEHVVEKCTLCAHLVDQGKVPACVTACNARASMFGDIDDPNSEISQKIRQAGDKVYQLRSEAGTEPSVRYILTKKTWQDMKSLRLR